ncbi:MAG: caspase family protein, partial [Rhodospirillales bacterium]
MKPLSHLLAIALICAVPGTAGAQSMPRDINVGNGKDGVVTRGEDKAAALGAERRIALVIGNAKYKTAPLSNPVNDARGMASMLEKLGFEVILKENASQRDMNRATTLFGQKLAGGGVGLFYYAGHGMQVKGRNFLVPVDAQIASEASIRSESIDVDQVLDQLNGARVSVVILDACRNNPFERSFRGSSGGLAQIDAPKGTFIAYATAPGKVASDGESGNGLYTRELLKTLDQPGLRVEDVFKRVRVQVAMATNDTQIPWETSSLTGDFYFIQPAETGAFPMPSGGEFSLEDLKQQQTASRAEWSKWQKKMQKGFDEAAKFKGAPELKLAAWDRFLTAFGSDNPFSNDDENLRQQAFSAKTAIEKAFGNLAMKEEPAPLQPAPQPQIQPQAQEPVAVVMEKKEAKTLSGAPLGTYQWTEVPIFKSRIGASGSLPFTIRKTEQTQLTDRVQERLFFREGGYLFYEELYFGGFRYDQPDKLL